MYTRKSLKNFFIENLEDARVVKLKFESKEKFEAIVKCKVEDRASIEEYGDIIASFIKKFAFFTLTGWIVRKTCSKPVRFVYRKTYICHLSAFNKTKTEGIRNKNCRASIDFKVKKVCSNTAKNDPYLKKGLNLTIQIDFSHTHLVHDKESLDLLKIDDAMTEVFLKYFEIGYQCTPARSYHEMAVIEKYGDDLKIIDNAALIPPWRHISYLWSNKRRSRPLPLQDQITERKLLVEITGGAFIRTDNADIIIVVTPFMKRVFLQMLSDIVFVDTTRMAFCSVTFFYVSSKIGVFPIACAVHDSEQKDIFSQIFLTVKVTLESNDINKSFEPNVIFTNDFADQARAAISIYPNSLRFTMPFDVCRSFWLHLNDKEHKIRRKSRHGLMEMFRQIIYAVSIDFAQPFFDKLMSHEILQENKSTRDFVDDVWRRCDEWMLKHNEYYDANVIESSVIFMRTSLRFRCKSLKSYQFVDVLINILDKHYCKMAMHGAKGTLTIEFRTKFMKKMKNITDFGTGLKKISSVEYKIASETKKTRLFTFRLDTYCCDCLDGIKARFCEHLCGLINLFETPLTQIPELKEYEKQLLIELSGLDNVEEETTESNMKDEDDENESREREDTSDEEDSENDTESNQSTPPSSPKQDGDDNSDDYYLVEVKTEKADKDDPLNNILNSPEEHEIIHDNVANIEPLPKVEFKVDYDKSMRALNNEFRRLNKLFKSNANAMNLDTMKRLSTELAKIRPIEKVNLKDLMIEVNNSDGVSKKRKLDDLDNV